MSSKSNLSKVLQRLEWSRQDQGGCRSAFRWLTKRDDAMGYIEDESGAC